MRILALVLAALSGAAGLAHQLLWVRRMVDILGADAGTFSKVVAAFFLGLASGAWLSARIATSRLWRAVGLAEIVVAALAVIVLLVGQIGDFGQGSAAWGLWLQWLLPLLLIIPPAFAMGMVVPWMIRATSPSLAVPIYAANTLGGILGIGLVLFWSLPTFGLTGSALVALSLNVIVAIGTLALADRPAASEGTAPIRTSPDFSSAALAFASGFLVLAAEVAFQHQLAQLLISSYFSSAFVLTLVLASLGLSAALVPAFSRFGAWALPGATAIAALAFALQPFVLIVQRGGLYYVPFEKTLDLYLAEALRIGLPGVFLILIPAGLVFPLLLRRGVNSGVDAGRLLAWNGVGGWLGAECMARVFMPVLGLWHVMSLLAFGYVATLLFCSGRLRWVLVPALGAAVFWTWHLDTRLPHIGLTKGDHAKKVSVGREGVVAVVSSAPDDWRIVVNNSYTLGGTRAQINQERQALLPILLHGAAHQVATLGVATGSTLGGALMDPEVRHAEGIELSPLVLKYASELPFHDGMSSDPRVRLTQGDARWVIGQRRGAFDVIVGDLFLPWGTGEARLFSREHFEKVRGALRPDGLYCQWLPMYQLTRTEFDAIVRTFRTVFPDAWLVRGDFYTSMPIVGLMGGRSLNTIDWTAVTAACSRIRKANLCSDPILRHSEGVAMMVLGPAPTPPGGPTITLANSWLEWDAAHNVIGLRDPWFIGVPLAEHLRSVQHRGVTQIPSWLQAAHASGDVMATYEVARAANLSEAIALEKRLNQILPEPVLLDPHSGKWPMNFPPTLYGQ